MANIISGFLGIDEILRDFINEFINSGGARRKLIIQINNRRTQSNC